MRSQWGCECLVAEHDSGSKGVDILFRNYFEYKIHNILKDREGQYFD